jgi:predicted lipoprotein with Yx(FWY)xxD motif
MKTTKFAFALLVSGTLAACSAYGTRADSPTMVSGGMVTGSNGMTLYTFDKDVAGSGKSMCSGPCAANWPPLFAMDSDMASGDYSIVTRDDMKKQWAFKGKPLYFWIKDQKPGDKTGDGFKDVWHVAKP